MKKMAFNVLSSAALLTTVAAPIVAVVAPTSSFAATKNTVVGAVPAVSSTGNATLGSIQISEDGTVGQIVYGDTFALTLPEGVKWNGGPTITSSTGRLTAVATSVTDQVYNVTITGANTAPGAAADTLTITTPVNVSSTGTGDIQLNVAAPGTGISEGNFTIGRFVSAGATATALNTSTNGGSGTYGTIRVVENAVGSLKNGKTVTLTLPAGFSWNGQTVTVNNGLALTTPNGSVDASGRVLTLTVATQTTSRPAIIDITTPITADNTAAKGDVKVSVGGTANVSGQDLNIGSYADFGTGVSAEAPKSIKAGVDSQTIADVTVAENVTGSLIPNRTITFDLPDNVRWGTAPTLTLDSGNNVWATAAGTLSNNGKTVTFTLAGTASTSKAKLKLIGQQIDVSPAFSGDVHVTVGGSAGVVGDIVPATVTPVVTSTSDVKTVQLGAQNQAIGDFTITEGDKGTLSAGTLTLTLPGGSSWAKVPNVTVADGDLQVDTVSKNGSALNITIKGASSVKASSIKVSDAEITVDRNQPEGNLKASLSGTALGAGNSTTAPRNTQVFSSTSYPSVVVASVQTGEVLPKTSFVIGQATYTVDGQEKSFDAAPFIDENGRTQLPVRAVAEALGATVGWDQETQTVSILKGGKAISVQVGSNKINVGGVSVFVDTKAVIKNDRVFLPFRAVAEALGANVSFDDATQTVTLN